MSCKRIFGTLGNLFLLLVLCTGQVAAAGTASASGMPATNTLESTIAPESRAASPTAVLWNTFLGSSTWDQEHTILTDQDGNIIVTGTSFDTWGQPILAHSPTLETSDVFIAKLDPNGALLWNTFLGGAGTDDIVDTVIDESGAIYVTGYSDTGWGDPVDLHHEGSQEDIFVAKINEDGGLVWNTFFGYSGGWDAPRRLEVASTGEVYVAGATASSYYSYGCGHWGTPISDIGCTFVTKLSADGQQLWNTFLGGEGRWDVFKAFAIDSAGYIYMVVSGGYDCDGYGCTFKDFVSKLNSDGTPLWTTFPEGEEYAYTALSDVAVDTTGNVYLAGSSQSAWGTPVNPHTSAQDSLVVKIDPAGNLLWHTFWGGMADDYASQIFVDPDGNIYIDGQSESDWGAPAIPYQGTGSNSFVAKLDTHGGLLWNTFPGGNGGDQIKDLVLTGNGNLFITGSSTEAWGTPASPFGDSTQSFIAELDLDGVLEWSSFIGSYSSSLTRDTSDHVFVVGQSYEAWGSPLRTPPGQFDVYVVKAGLPAPPAVSSDLSTVTVQPASVPADGLTYADVTVTLRDTNNAPVSGKRVILIAERGGNDQVVQPPMATDENGQTTGRIASLFPGASQIRAVDVTDNVKLSQRPSVQFTDSNPALRQRITTLNTLSTDSLNRVALYAQSAGGDGDYFRGAIAEDVGEMVFDALGLFTGTAEGVKDIQKLKGGVQLALPGLEDAGYGVVDGVLKKYPQSGDLFNFAVRKALKSGDYRGLTQPVLNAGLRYYAAKYLSKKVGQDKLEDLTQDQAIDAWKKIYSSSGGFSEAGGWLAEDVNNLKTELDRLSGFSTPSMSAAQQAAYVNDLHRRSMVPVILADVTRQQVFLLENVRDAHESNAWSGNFNLKFMADALATTAFDGPGHIMVNGLTKGFDLYLNYRKFDGDARAFAQVPGILKGSMETATAIYTNEATGLDRVYRLLPPRTVTGQITAVRNYSQGQFRGPFYFEDRSFSEIDIRNTSTSQAATFEVIAQYGYNTRIFGVPWAYMPLVKSEARVLLPGESTTIRIDYKDGGSGGSPDRDDLLIFNVLAANSTGEFYIGTKRVSWNPELARSDIGTWSMEDSHQIVSASEVAVVENPITTYVTSNPADQTYQAEIYVANPFDQPMEVHLTQNLPAALAVLATDGTLDGSLISWQESVGSGRIERFTFAFRYTADPDEMLSLPAALMTFVEPASDQPVSVQSNIAEFLAVSPLALEGYAPVSLPGVESAMSITVTNRIDVPSSGTIGLTLAGENGQVFTDTRPFSVNALGQQTVTFTLPPLSEGLYPLEVFITTNGKTRRAFGDTVQVIPPPTVASITRASADPTSAAQVDFVVTFTEPVTGMDLSSPFTDLSLATTGEISGASISAVSGSNATYTVTVDTGSGAGTIRLDVLDDDSIHDAAGNPLGGAGDDNGSFQAGAAYAMIVPARPVLLLPARNSYIGSSTLTFTWDDRSAADRYDIQFATDNAFTENVNLSSIMDPVFSGSFMDGKYFWRVQTYDLRNSASGWSTPRSFMVDTSKPNPPGLRLPANGVSLRGVPTFRWDPVSGAVLYQFQFDDDLDFSSPLVSASQRTTSRKPAGRLRGTYFWRVRAQDAAGNWSDWSQTFTVDLLPPR